VHGVVKRWQFPAISCLNAVLANWLFISVNFVATATPETLVGTLLEEIGHFVDAQINQTDTVL
jgi:hypothetical protein